MKQIQSIILILSTSGFISSARGAHVLFLHLYATYSHVIVSWPLATALDTLGHKVSYMSSTPGPDEINASAHPNISFFVPEGLGQELGDRCKDDFGLKYRLGNGWQGGSSIPLFLISPRSNPILCEALLSSKDFQKWLHKTESSPENKVDLVVLDTNLDCGLGIAWKLKAKVVSFQLMGSFMETLDALSGGGGASEMISNLLIPHNNPLSLFQRIKTTLASLVNHIATRRMWRQIEDLFRKHLAVEEVPTIGEMMKNVSLVLSNGHFLEEHRRPLPPNFVSVPGIHVKETHSRLPEDVESFIAKSDTGFIYISLGTVVVLDELPQTIKSMFFNAIRKFPNIQFLWKWDGKLKPSNEEMPKNLLIKNWFRQQDLFGHPKVLGFVTQAGRPSSQEAIFNAVPLVTLPVQGDQDYNSYMLEDLGVSVNLEISQLTTDKLVASFNKLVNKELNLRSLEVSKVLKDTPMKPVDKAVWWIEYALRHDTTVTSHLQPLSMERSWAVKWHLDVWGSIFGATIAFIYTVVTLFTKLIQLCSSTSKKVRSKKLKAK